MKNREIQLDVRDLTSEEELKLLDLIRDFAINELPKDKYIWICIKEIWNARE